MKRVLLTEFRKSGKPCWGKRDSTEMHQSVDRRPNERLVSASCLAQSHGLKRRFANAMSPIGPEPFPVD